MRQSSGTTPVSNDFWNISCSSDEISVASSLRILGDMLSDPGALYGFSCFSNFVIPLQVMSKYFIFGCCVVVEFMRFEFRNSSTTSKNMAFEAINNNFPLQLQARTCRSVNSLRSYLRYFCFITTRKNM